MYEIRKIRNYEQEKNFMNIGVDVRSLMSPIRTGVGEYTYELLNALFSFDRENQYFLFYNSYTDVSRYIPKWRYNNVQYVATRYPNKLFNASLYFFNKPYLDLITSYKLQVPSSTKLDYFFSPNLNFTSLSPRVKHILTIHDLSFEFFPDCFSLKQRAWHQLVKPKEQCKRAHLILVPSQNTKRDVVEYYGVAEEKVKVMYPGLGAEFGVHSSQFVGQIRDRYHLPEKFVLFLGTIEPRKNIEGIIEAFRSSSELRTMNYELIIAGSLGWKHREVLRLIEQTPGVRYIGYIHEADKPALYQLAHAFVYPSLYEGFGFPVLEAMASGTPVVTSNRSSLPEVVGDAVYLVNPYNISEITRGMELLTTDEKLRTTFIERGKKQAEQFSWEKSAQEFLKIINYAS